MRWRKGKRERDKYRERERWRNKECEYVGERGERWRD